MKSVIYSIFNITSLGYVHCVIMGTIIIQQFKYSYLSELSNISVETNYIVTVIIFCISLIVYIMYEPCNHYSKNTHYLLFIMYTGFIIISLSIFGYVFITIEGFAELCTLEYFLEYIYIYIRYYTTWHEYLYFCSIQCARKNIYLQKRYRL